MSKSTKWLALLLSLVTVVSILLASCAPAATETSATEAPTQTNVPTRTDAPTKTETPNPTFTAGPSPTGTADPNGVVFGPTRAVGTKDGDGEQYSVIMWKHGQPGIVYSTSMSKVLISMDDNRETPMDQMTPTVGYRKCTITNAAFGYMNVEVAPCYPYVIPADTYAVAAPNVRNPDQYNHGHLEGGPEVYMPKTPTVVPTLTSTATATFTPMPTQIMTLPTPVSDDSQVQCGGDVQNATYSISLDPQESACINPPLTNQPTGTMQFKVNDKFYTITLSVNPDRFYATYILGGSIPLENTVCTLNGTRFDNGNQSNTVRLQAGNLNSRLECSFEDIVITAIASAK